jgi:hypothetical protein
VSRRILLLSPVVAALITNVCRLSRPGATFEIEVFGSSQYLGDNVLGSAQV